MEGGELLHHRVRTTAEPQLAQAEADRTLVGTGVFAVSVGAYLGGRGWPRWRHCCATTAEELADRVPAEVLSLQCGRLLVVFTHSGEAAIQKLVRRGLPSVLGTLLLVIAHELRDQGRWVERHPQSQMVGGREGGGLEAVARIVHRWMRPLDRAWPHRDGLKPVKPDRKSVV